MEMRENSIVYKVTGSHIEETYTFFKHLDRIIIMNTYSLIFEGRLDHLLLKKRSITIVFIISCGRRRRGFRRLLLLFVLAPATLQQGLQNHRV